jgi:hypothetical protein
MVFFQQNSHDIPFVLFVALPFGLSQGDALDIMNLYAGMTSMLIILLSRLDPSNLQTRQWYIHTLSSLGMFRGTP